MIKLCKEVGFSGPYLVTARPFVVEPHLRQPLGRCLNCVVKLFKFVTTKNCTLVLFFSIVGNAQFVAATYRLFKVLNSSETVASRVTYKGMSNSEPKSIKTPKGRRSKGDEKSKK